MQPSNIFYSYKYKCEPYIITLPKEYLAQYNTTSYWQRQRNSNVLPLPNIDNRLVKALQNIGFGIPTSPTDTGFSQYPDIKNGIYTASYGYQRYKDPSIRNGWCQLVYVSPTQINVRIEAHQKFHDQFFAELGIKHNPKSDPKTRPTCASGIIHVDPFNQEILLDQGVLYTTRGSGGLSCGKVIGWTAKQVRIAAIKTNAVEFAYPSNVFVLDQDMYIMKVLIS